MTGKNPTTLPPPVRLYSIHLLRQAFPTDLGTRVEKHSKRHLALWAKIKIPQTRHHKCRIYDLPDIVQYMNDTPDFWRAGSRAPSRITMELKMLRHREKHTLVVPEEIVQLFLFSHIRHRAAPQPGGGT